MNDFMVPGFSPAITNKIGLIDADFIKYLVVTKIATAKKNKEEMMIHSDALAKFTEEVINERFTTQIDSKGNIFCFSGVSENTFRSYVAFEKKYKGNRGNSEMYYGVEDDKMSVVKYIKERYPTLIFKDLEADDILSMLHCDDTFIYSEDKDLLQLAGTHYDIKEKCFVKRSQQEAFNFLMFQMIEGDTVDNIGGLKSYGTIKSNELLTNLSSTNMVKTVFNEYMKVHGIINGIDCFTESWNLLKLRGNRGAYFTSKYKLAFDTLEMLKLQK